MILQAQQRAKGTLRVCWILFQPRTRAYLGGGYRNLEVLCSHEWGRWLMFCDFYFLPLWPQQPVCSSCLSSSQLL